MQPLESGPDRIPQPGEAGPSSYASSPARLGTPPSTFTKTIPHRSPSPSKRKASLKEALPDRIYPGFLAKKKAGRSGAVESGSESESEVPIQIRSPTSPEAVPGPSRAPWRQLPKSTESGWDGVTRRTSGVEGEKLDSEDHVDAKKGEGHTRLPYVRSGQHSEAQEGVRMAATALKRSPSGNEDPTDQTDLHSVTAVSGTTKHKTARRRPAPLDLRAASDQPGMDPELKVHMDDINSATSAISIAPTSASSFTNDQEDLSALRSAFRQNLRDRQVERFPDNHPESDPSGFSMPNDSTARPSDGTPFPDTLSPEQLGDWLSSKTDLLVIDTRPLGDYLEMSLPCSANISIPSLIFKRLKKGAGTKPSWESLAAFVTTPEGRQRWDSASPRDGSGSGTLAVMGASQTDGVAQSLAGILTELLPGRDVRLVSGGWEAVSGFPEVTKHIKQEIQDSVDGGDPSAALAVPAAPARINSLPSNPSQPQAEPSFTIAPPTPPSISMPRLASKVSMPSLREKRGLPSLPPPLDVSGNYNTSVSCNSPARSPRLALNLSNPPRSATVDTFSPGKLGGIRPLKSPGLSLLTIDTSMGKGQSTKNTSFPMSPTSDPRQSSFQTAVHEQAKRGPSPSSFGEITTPLRRTFDSGPTSSRFPPPSSYGADQTSDTFNYTAEPDSLVPSLPPRSPHPYTARNALSPFIVSTILPGFLYLGPEITNEDDMEVLRKLGVKRVLNVAFECDDEGDLMLKKRFEKYLKVPMRDMVEESGVGKGMRDSCDFLDDARLHDAPTYVHCKAGKSRSVTVVLAYLIHANAWTLKTSYAYVSERRKGISPNIGFVAELMQFEEAELGLKQSGGVHGESAAANDEPQHSGTGSDSGRESGKGGTKGKSKPHLRYARESLPPQSLPPAWGSLDSAKPKRIDLGRDTPDNADAQRQDAKHKDEEEEKRWVDEREVRKNGQWVHHRRVPVDRSTLQPGRRASKAGLESLRPLAIPVPSPKPSPQPSPTAGNLGTVTPGGVGRVGWV